MLSKKKKISLLNNQNVSFSAFNWVSFNTYYFETYLTPFEH